MKLGDFGLSKLMKSHDFASTYVGTPFYMSPEICAAEKYTLHSDIWALGCIMYELCQKAPPFNAKTHIQLVQRIREGKFAPLPEFYSSELKSVIASCLSVNPVQRPDTAALLNLPIVRLMRKERDVIELSTKVKRREEATLQKMKDLEAKLASHEKDKALTREEIEATVRREWEVKARLEIERQVQMRYDELSKQFDSEVRARVASELEKHEKHEKQERQNRQETLNKQEKHIKSKVQQSQQSHESSSSSEGYSEESDFPSTTDISDVSFESPRSSRNKPIRRETRTPFCRAKTTVESPVDVQMGEPSPITIASLSLSPRRTAPVSKNLFSEPQSKGKWEPHIITSDDEEDVPDLPSPTRPRVKPDPLKPSRRPLLRHQTTAMVQKMSHQPSIFPSGTSRLPPPAANAASTQSETRQVPELRSKSPNRRLSKIPSTSNLMGDAGSPTRKGVSRPLNSKNASGGEDMHKAVMQRNLGGRTLVELMQARAGGRSVDDAKRISSDSRVYTSGLFDDKSTADSPATWDPATEEMPSPFLSRKVGRSIR